jgi:hypothetical protein
MADAHLNGSLNLPSADDVFRTVAAIAGRTGKQHWPFVADDLVTFRQLSVLPQRTIAVISGQTSQRRC